VTNILPRQESFPSPSILILPALKESDAKRYNPKTVPAEKQNLEPVTQRQGTQQIMFMIASKPLVTV
jgi:hypothetical protein